VRAEQGGAAFSNGLMVGWLLVWVLLFRKHHHA
jgi:hypothetical protein